jgi:Fe-Mn family superoxide dismutase
VAKLNEALAGSDVPEQSIEDLCRNINTVPEKIRAAVRNNGGGHANHSMFWEIMGPGGGGSPSGPLADDITKSFGSLETLKTQIKQAGLGQFGSGWAWLVVADGGLKVVKLPNQDSPYLTGQVPVLGVDVWEHAYYLKYQNKRADYLDAWWNVVNWGAIAKRYTNAKAGKA